MIKKFIWILIICALSNGKSVYAENKPFALVELFTSEGCSSCPPADELFSLIIKQSREKDINIISLSFHVDYWDRLGWKDPYADSLYTERQRQYAQKFKLKNLFTPQMIVNGRNYVAGHQNAKIDALVNDELKLRPNFELKIKSIEFTKDKHLKISYTTSPKLPKNILLNVALVERGLSNKIKKGENKGKILNHDNVVRVFQSTNNIQEAGELEILTTKIKNKNNAAMILYLQDPQDMLIWAADTQDLPI